MFSCSAFLAVSTSVYLLVYLGAVEGAVLRLGCIVQLPRLTCRTQQTLVPAPDTIGTSLVADRFPSFPMFDAYFAQQCICQDVYLS